MQALATVFGNGRSLIIIIIISKGAWERLSQFNLFSKTHVMFFNNIHIQFKVLKILKYYLLQPMSLR